MFHYVIYDQATGAISCAGSAYALAEISADMPEGHGALIFPEPVLSVRGKIVVDGELVDDPTPPAENLPELKAQAQERVFAAVAELRARFLTVLPGQELIYSVKEAEAKALQALVAAGLTPNPVDFPFLQAEVDLRPELSDLPAAAAFILGHAATFRQVGAPLEKIRLGAVIALEAATTRPEVEAAEAAALAAISALAAA